MLKLRTILLRKELYYSILILSLFVTVIRINIPNTIPIKNTYTNKIKSIGIDGNKMTIVVDRIQGTYYIKTKEELDEKKKLKIGDKVTIIGEFRLPEKEYQNILKSKNIDLTGRVTKITYHNSNLLYFPKNLIRKRLNSNPYLYTFLLGDKSLVSSAVLNSYQENGISHLFAISGMHISLLSGILLKVLKKVREEKRYLYSSIFLISFLLLVGPSPSILRGVLFFLLFSINKVYYFYIKNTHLYIVALCITLLYNPYYLFDTGFQYSFTISLSLILNTEYLKSKNYFLGLLKTSIISFLSSVPISLYHSYSINLSSILYNLFYVPFISYLVFPLSLICLIFPFLVVFLNPLTNLLETSSLFLEQFRIFTFVFKKCSILLYLIYGVLLFFSYTKKRKIQIIFYSLLFLHFLFPYLYSEDSLYLLDVGQGDSILLVSNHHSVLIDTGGITSRDYEEWQEKKNTYSIVKNKTIPFLKSLGLNKIDTLILTHGDYDHLGEAENLIRYFQVGSIILNNNYINYYEERLMKIYKKVEISYPEKIVECGDIKLVQLNDDLKDENDSSQIYFGYYKNITMLFTGDASKKSEHYILEQYDLPLINILYM